MMNAIYFCNLKGDILHRRGMYQGYYAFINHLYCSFTYYFSLYTCRPYWNRSIYPINCF